MKKSLLIKLPQRIFALLLVIMGLMINITCSPETEEPKEEKKPEPSDNPHNKPSINKPKGPGPGGGHSKEDNITPPDKPSNQTGKEGEPQEQKSDQDNQLIEVPENNPQDTSQESNEVNNESEETPSDREGNDNENIKENEQEEQVIEIELTPIRKQNNPLFQPATKIPPKSKKSVVQEGHFDFTKEPRLILPKLDEDYFSESPRHKESNELDKDASAKRSTTEIDQGSKKKFSVPYNETSHATQFNEVIETSNMSRETSDNSGYVVIATPPSRSKTPEVSPPPPNEKIISQNSGNKFLESLKIELRTDPPFENINPSSNLESNVFFSVKLKPQYTLDNWSQAEESKILFTDNEEKNKGSLHIKLGACPKNLTGRNGYYRIGVRKGSKLSTMINNQNIDKVYDKIHFRYIGPGDGLTSDLKIQFQIKRIDSKEVENLILTLHLKG